MWAKRWSRRRVTVAASWASPRATRDAFGELGRGTSEHEAAGAGGGAVTVSTVGRAAASDGGMVGVTA